MFLPGSELLQNSNVRTWESLNMNHSYDGTATFRTGCSKEPFKADFRSSHLRTGFARAVASEQHALDITACGKNEEWTLWNPRNWHDAIPVKI
jgi:hypothetical protein